MKHITLNKFIIFSLAVCVLSLAVVQTAFAQERAGIGIQPALVEEIVTPGDTYTFNMRVINNSDQEQEYFIFARDIRELNSAGQPIFVDEDEKIEHGLSEWISFNRESLTIAPDEDGQIEVIVQVPDTASPGGHFGAVFVSLEPPDIEEGTATRVGANVGTLMNFRIAGDITEEMQIREFSTDKSIYTKSEVRFTAKVENLGNVLLRPSGPLEITNIFGQKVATLTINETGRGVFPGQVRDFEITWEGGRFAFGRYQALAGLVYGQDARKSIDATISFWILPMNIILPVGGGLLVLIVSVILLMRWMVNRKVKMLEQVAGDLTKAKKQAQVDRKLSAGNAAPVSKLAMIALSLLVLALIFLILLFFLFG